MTTCDCGSTIRWRTSKRQGRLVVRYGACLACGKPAKVLASADAVKRRKRLTTVSASRVVSTADSRIGSGGREVLIVGDLQPLENEMTKREKLVRQIREIDENAAVSELRQELADVRQRIDDHELSRLHRQSIEIAQQIRIAEAARMAERNRVESLLQDAEPQQVADLRNVITLALNRHTTSTPPTIVRDRLGNLSPEYCSWRDRGLSLSACSTALRDAWRADDPTDVLRQLVAEHGKVLPELRYLSIQESEHAAA